MSYVVRFDQSSAGEFRKDENGFLTAPASLTRTGVFAYRNDDGSTRFELRQESEVFSDAAMDSMRMLPVTNEHPPEMLSPENTKDFAVGFGGETIERDGTIAKTSLKITDAKTIQDIESKIRQEISMGYTAELEFTPGEWEGIRYDAIQRNIRYNHIAVVTRGRAGPQVRIKVDSDDVRSSVNDELQTHGGKRMKKIRFDGFEIEIDDNAAVALEKRLHQDKDTMKEMEDKVTELKDALEKAQKELDAMKGKKDASDEQIKELTEKLEQAKKDSEDIERINKLVAERSALIEQVKPFIQDEEIKLDSMTPHDMKLAAVKSRFPKMDLDKASEDRIQGIFDTIIATADLKPASEHMDEHMKNLGEKDDLEKIRRDARERDCNLWKTMIKQE